MDSSAGIGSFSPGASAETLNLRLRLDELLGRLHELTRRRDAGDLTCQASLPLELSLTFELGQVEDRLQLLGWHSYDGCRECRPVRTPVPSP